MTVQLEPEIESQFDEAAEQMGETKDNLIRKVLLSYLEDLHDARIAEERLKDIGERISLDEIGRKYGLVD